MTEPAAQKLADLILQTYEEAQRSSLLHAASLYALNHEKLISQWVADNRVPMWRQDERVVFEIFSVEIKELFTLEDAREILGRYNSIFSKHLVLFRQRLGHPDVEKMDVGLWEEVEPQAVSSFKWHGESYTLELVSEVSGLKSSYTIHSIIENLQS